MPSGQKMGLLPNGGKWGHIAAIKSSQMVVGNHNVMAADIHLSFHPSDKTPCRRPQEKEWVIIMTADIQADTQSRAAPLDILIETKF